MSSIRYRYTINSLLVLLVSCAGSAADQSSRQGSKASSFDFERERAAVIAAVEEEANAFAAKDTERLFACYVSEKDYTRIQQLSGNKEVLKYKGPAADHRATFNAYFRNTGGEVWQLIKRLNLEVDFSADKTQATITFTQIIRDGGGRTKSEEIRTLEKENGHWKISMVSSIIH